MIHAFTTKGKHPVLGMCKNSPTPPSDASSDTSSVVSVPPPLVPPLLAGDNTNL